MRPSSPSRPTMSTDCNESGMAGLSAAHGSAKSRYWRVTRRPENQRQFPGEYATLHILMVEATHEEAHDWANGYFLTDEIVKVELWPSVPVSPNAEFRNGGAGGADCK